MPGRTLRRANRPGAVSTHTVGVSPSRTMARAGTAGTGVTSPVRMRKLANISGLSLPAPLATSARTATRWVAGSAAAPTEEMRA